MSQPAPRKPLRLWPGVVALVLLIVLRYVLPIVAPEAFFIGLLGGVISAAAIVVWWLFFSRAPWSERLGAIVLMVVGVMAAARIVHVSIRTGMMGIMLPVYSIFVLPPALVLWAVATRRLSPTARRIASWRRSRLPAARSRSCEQTASTAAALSSRGDGRRQPKSGCSQGAVGTGAAGRARRHPHAPRARSKL